MTKRWTLTEDSFETLLGWLAPERETAGQMYETIRRRLIEIFRARGCYQDAEALADETINRVARKIPEIADDYRSEETANYFYGVAYKLYLEWRRRTPEIVELNPIDAAQIPQPPASDDPQDAPIYQCLKKCLPTLAEDEQKLVLEYYEGDKDWTNRKKLAAEQNLTIGNLRVRAHRLRERLERCVRACLKNSNKNL